MASTQPKRAFVPPEGQDEGSPQQKRRSSVVGDVESSDKENQFATTASLPAATVPRTLSQPRPVAGAGIIKQIYVENFMCHRRLRVDLCRNVNFIHGQNGSGKSAILAAIQICLGAGARRTHRARSLKDLVRRDGTSTPSQAVVRVTLYNEGSDAYQHDVYGDSITVERKISFQSGGSQGYKLLDENGVCKSHARKDLEAMLDHLNIQVENPVAVLDQEEAKKFLQGKSTDKYNFFMKATELERVDRTYLAILDTISDLHNNQARIQTAVGESQERVRELKLKWDQYKQLDKFEEKLRALQIKYAWAIANAAEEEHNHALEAKAAFEEKAAKKEEEITQAEAAGTGPDEEIQRARDRMDELTEEAKKQVQLKQQLDTQLRELILPSKALERQIQSVQREKSQIAKDLVTAKKNLQRIRDEVLAKAGSAESEAALRTEKLKKAEQELEEAKSKVNGYKQEVSSALRSYEELGPHVLEAKARVEASVRQQHGAKSTLDELRSSAHNELAILGPRVTKVQQLVLDAVNRRKFKGKVLGPIGAFVKVVPGKEEYAAIAEKSLGVGILDRFIVTNDHDRQVLSNIRRQAGCNTDCGLFQVTPSERYNVPPPPGDGVETTASVLHVEDDTVFNCLVDQAKIDQKALARDKESSEQQLLGSENGQYFIRNRNIKEVFLMPKGDYWQVKNGSLAMFSNDKDIRKTLGVDKTAAIEMAETELARRQEEAKALKAEESKLEGEHSKFQRQWNHAKKAMQENDTRISHLVKLIDEIKIEIESNAEISVDTSAEEGDVEQAEKAMEATLESERKLKEEFEGLQPQIQEAKRRVDECAMRNGKVMKDIAAVENNLTQIMDTQSQQQTILEKKKQKLAKYREAIEKHQEKIDALAADADEKVQTAKRVTFRFGMASESSPDELRTEPTEDELAAIEPVPVEKDIAYYEVRITKIKEEIKRERSRRKLNNEDPTIAYEKYARACKDLEAKEKQNEELESRIADLHKDMRKRQRRWTKFREYLAQKSNVLFAEMLGLNKYTGYLSFDHESQNLYLLVSKNGQETAKDVKGLSGGERSYTTICLLLALGESLETPFRILDEFDVFLDAQVRKLTIQTLIYMAKQLQHRQFIFITPQDLSSVAPDPQLRILKLNPPSRRAVEGGPSQQTLPYSASQQQEDDD